METEPKVSDGYTTPAPGSPNSDSDNAINTPKTIGQRNNQNETASQAKESQLATKKPNQSGDDPFQLEPRSLTFVEERARRRKERARRRNSRGKATDERHAVGATVAQPDATANAAACLSEGGLEQLYHASSLAIIHFQVTNP